MIHMGRVDISNIDHFMSSIKGLDIVVFLHFLCTSFPGSTCGDFGGADMSTIPEERTECYQ